MTAVATRNQFIPQLKFIIAVKVYKCTTTTTHAQTVEDLAH